MARRLRMAAVAAPLLLGCSGEPTPHPDVSDPGRVTMHRLNRSEYNNTVQDLLGTAQRPADDFPTDDYGYGFDNVADVLSISPTQMELYERAAEALAHEAMVVPTTAVQQRFEGETLMSDVGGPSDEAWNVWSNGELPAYADFSVKGKYAIRTRVWGQQAGPDPVKISIAVSGQSLGTFDVPNTAQDPAVFEVIADVDAGKHVVSVSFLNDYYDQPAGADRNLLVDWIEVEGPLDAPGKNAIRDKLLVCDPVVDGDTCVRDILGQFATRAFRRPVSADEVDRLMGLVDVARSEGDSVERGIELAIHGILTSPHFIFRPEIDKEPASAEPHPVGDHEMASRLSYFLWSSMPDDALFEAAKGGDLRNEAGIEAQVQRMIDDEKSDRFVENFAGQWLYTRALKNHQPDYNYFPTYDEALGNAMRRETELFLREFLREELPVQEMLTAKFTFANDRLAAHYGFDVMGSEMVKVTVPDDKRGGLLKQAGILTVTSYPTRTTPVKRGKWVLTQLLCDPPDPPPPGVEGLKIEEVPTGTIRERLAAHAKYEPCKGCHAKIDPPGFALEHYDGIGAWRTEENGFPVDATGSLSSGETFDGAEEMAQLISKDPRFTRCLTKQLMTYALGRGLYDEIDAPFLEKIEADLPGRGYTLRGLITLIATSEPFRMRRGEPEGGTP
jgi:Protein of unknown function (DUF1592)/Protein of unknown function (DUF1588)/Protein of unknown function (DUF1587)/Protein of unknown function (DUF1595)/Protein of unknown function (DUF1585)/Ca-dependent carbohydrate-binding module xylan-binding